MFVHKFKSLALFERIIFKELLNIKAGLLARHYCLYPDNLRAYFGKRNVLSKHITEYQGCTKSATLMGVPQIE